MNRDLTTVEQDTQEEILENLYDRLGIPPSATALQIKKAYRELSLFYHPDNQRTGDERMFEAIKEAYDILINPQTRAKYDEDGMIEKQRLDDPIEVEAREQCGVILSRIIQEEQDPDFSNILDKLKHVWAAQEKSFDQRRHELDKQERVIKSIRKRLKRKKAEKQKRSAILLMMLDHHIKQVSLGRERLAHDRAVFAKVVEIFAEYDYKVDMRNPFETEFYDTREEFERAQSRLNMRGGTRFFHGGRPFNPPDDF